MQKVVVTGGAGFIGSHLVEGLLAAGYAVTVVDNLSTGSYKNIEPWINQIEWLEGSILDPQLLQKAFKDVEIVFHLAAVPSVPRSIADPWTSNINNIDGTLQVLLAARDAGVRRLIYSASSSVYGNAPVPIKDERLPANPRSPYALTKYVGEVYSRLFTEQYGLETLALRYFNVFGSRQNPNGEYAAVIPRFITAMLQGQSPTIYGDGQQSRDFTPVANVVQANLLAAASQTGIGEVMNIACGQQTSLNQLVEIINQELQTDIKPTYLPDRPGDVTHSRADITKAEQLIGYRPTLDFATGLKQAVSWYKEPTFHP